MILGLFNAYTKLKQQAGNAIDKNAWKRYESGAKKGRYWGMAYIAKHLLDDKDDIEGGIGYYTKAIKMQQELIRKKSKPELYAFFLRHIWSVFVLGDVLDAEEASRVKKGLRGILHLHDENLEKRQINLIALSQLYFRNARTKKHLEAYEKTCNAGLEQKILIAMVYEALNEKEYLQKSDKIWLDVYTQLRQDAFASQEILPTMKGKVYSIESKKFLKSNFLFKESDDLSGLNFEADCSNILNDIFKDENKITASSIRRPIQCGNDIYLSVIKREKCIDLGDVTENKAGTFRNVAECLALIHLMYPTEGLQHISFEKMILESPYDNEIKNEILHNSRPLEASLVHVPIAFHKDSHPANYGIKENGIVVFDCENKGMRKVTQDLAKLFLLSGLNDDEIGSGIESYVKMYNLKSELMGLRRQIFNIELPFLNSAVQLAFTYPSKSRHESSGMNYNKKCLLEQGLNAINKIKEKHNAYYLKYQQNYNNMASLINGLAS